LPVMADGGPTREHSGKGAFLHIVSKSPKPILVYGIVWIDGEPEFAIGEAQVVALGLRQSDEEGAMRLRMSQRGLRRGSECVRRDSQRV
jgi:hypothetical protein